MAEHPDARCPCMLPTSRDQPQRVVQHAEDQRHCAEAGLAQVALKSIRVRPTSPRDGRPSEQSPPVELRTGTASSNTQSKHVQLCIQPILMHTAPSTGLLLARGACQHHWLRLVRSPTCLRASAGCCHGIMTGGTLHDLKGNPHKTERCTPVHARMMAWAPSLGGEYNTCGNITSERACSIPARVSMCPSHGLLRSISTRMIQFSGPRLNIRDCL